MRLAYFDASGSVHSGPSCPHTRLQTAPRATNPTSPHPCVTAGLVTTTVTNPVDVVKTIIYVSGNKFRGPMHAASHLLKTEGPKGFLKGWLANYSRLGPQTIIAFMVAENLRRMAGMPSL